ncbi:hypothetical protein K438DRAFT_2101630 [Mycena galopus ATCC 62051]|nr:hypothetical protein K438DRAFT_2101630 [Mycena galopus ATCC 62051]
MEVECKPAPNTHKDAHRHISSFANFHCTPWCDEFNREVAQSRMRLFCSDVLADLRVNVTLKGSEKVLWFRERFLEDEEIIEHLVHNETWRIQWTMHRPRNGWYIHIRSSAFQPGAFIPLIPPRPDSAHPPGALLFESRTNAPISHTQTSMPSPSRARARPHRLAK